MNNKELKLQIAALKKRAQLILAEKEAREALTPKERILNFLETLFTCSDPLEIWLPYPANHDYMVSNLGQVKSTKFNREIILEQITNTKGYKQVSIFHQGKRTVMKVHRLVAETFIINFDDKPHVNHLDENKANNEVINLEWCTPRENKHHSLKKNNTTSKYIGVSYRKSRGKYVATIVHNGKSHFLGYHEEEEAARDAYLSFIKENNISLKYVA